MIYQKNIAGLLQNSIQRREPLKKITNALRLVNGQGDGIPGITVDQYNRHLVIQFFQMVDPAVLAAVKDLIAGQLNPNYLIIKNRIASDGRSLDRPAVEVVIQKENSKTIVTENGLRFNVDLNDTVNTGLFLDMRSNRQKVAALCKGKKVLNCFAYTCSFGVYCRRVGATEVVNVDISKKALEKGKENYSLNEIAPTSAEFVRANCLEYLARAAKKDNRFDVIILDPPSFSRHDGKAFSVKNDMPKLIAMALKILNSDGQLFVSTNSSSITLAQLKDFVRKESSASGRVVKVMTPLGQDVDFPGSGTMKESCLAAVFIEIGH